MKLVVSNAAVTWGGGEVMAEAVALGLQRRGHEVVVFCHPGSVLHERLRDRLVCEPVLSRMDFAPGSIFRAVQALRRHRPRVVYASIEKDTRLTAVAAHWTGIPTVSCRAVNRPFRNSFRHRFLYGRVVAHCVVNSHATLNTVLGSAPWLDPSRLSVIHNGIDVERFAAASPLALALPPDALVIGFVGRFSPEKGLPELADAWLRMAGALPAAHLVLAGSGPLEAELRARLAGAPRVHWFGFEEDVAAMMKAFDVLAVPSYEEGFGLVAAEAMAAGVPVVASRVGGLVEVVDDGRTGCLVPPRNALALADALLLLANDPDRRRRMGAAGEERARRCFSLERMLDRYESLLEAVAAGGRPPAPESSSSVS
jgi:glycosyltransferase involved in cell wall biosynthesis